MVKFGTSGQAIVTIKKCSYADKYKAIHPPKCNDGNPCWVCREKWEAANKEEAPSEDRAS